MNKTSLLALVIAIGVPQLVQAQTPTATWYAQRFGLNVSPPPIGNTSGWNRFRNREFQEGSRERYNNSRRLTQASMDREAKTERAFSDPDCRIWQDMFEVTDSLPAGTWVRTSGLLEEHFYGPATINNPTQFQRVTDALIGRMMFRNGNVADSLNIMFNITPSIHPHIGASDAWNNIRVSPTGQALSTPIAGPAPRDRDWWRPDPVYFPYLRAQLQNFVNFSNEEVIRLARRDSRVNIATFPYSQKLAFQLGNEPGVGHPGGSQFGQVGSWHGLGAVMQGVTANLSWRARPSVVTAQGANAKVTNNQLVLPAFSFLTEPANVVKESRVNGRVRNFNVTGAVSAFFNEVATYGPELNMSWANQCTRRSVHFRSPTYRWKFNQNDLNNVRNQDTDMLFYGPGDPAWGRWETPQEYARRWVRELEKVVDAIAALPMSNPTRVVDVTECYLPLGELNYAICDDYLKLPDGNNLNPVGMTVDELREVSRRHSRVGNDLRARLPQQIPPTRTEIIIAIRNEIFRRDTVTKDLSRNLGRIYWWGGYTADPMYETGITRNPQTNRVWHYNPHQDIQLNLEEVKALFGSN